jgi:hypothetical protein
MSLREDINDTIGYLAEHAQSDFRNLPEGTVANVLNGLSPEARKDFNVHFKGTQHLVESGGRLAPFETKVPVEVYTTKPMRDTYQRLEDEQLYTGLQERMGTQEQNERIINDAPVSLREVASAAFDHHEGSTND